MPPLQEHSKGISFFINLPSSSSSSSINRYVSFLMVSHVKKSTIKGKQKQRKRKQIINTWFTNREGVNGLFVIREKILRYQI